MSWCTAECPRWVQVAEDTSCDARPASGAGDGAGRLSPGLKVELVVTAAVSEG
jgi:hypothetical protein